MLKLGMPAKEQKQQFNAVIEYCRTHAHKEVCEFAFKDKDGELKRLRVENPFYLAAYSETILAETDPLKGDPFELIRMQLFEEETCKWLI